TEHGIAMGQLEGIPGTGLNGRLTKKDLINFIDNQRTDPTSTSQIDITIPSSADLMKKTEIIPMDNMRKSIAEHMIQSKQTSAHVSLYNEVDMSAIYAIRESNKANFKKREGISLTYMPFIVESVVKALKEYPLLNASIEDDKILVKKYYNIGIAVAVENGLIVPNIFNCDDKNLVGLSRAVYDLAVRARNKKLKPDELTNGTFSISNFGVYDLTMGFPIINQPQVAILGVGALKKRAVVINDAIAIRPMMYLSLTIDHRLIDGAMGAKFLQRIQQFLESYDSEFVI
ncbi:MAG: dihydrolipoamide acetyltransferase family protein, partial [Calditrichaceae bacterium]